MKNAVIEPLVEKVECTITTNNICEALRVALEEDGIIHVKATIINPQTQSPYNGQNWGQPQPKHNKGVKRVSFKGAFKENSPLFEKVETSVVDRFNGRTNQRYKLSKKGEETLFGKLIVKQPNLVFETFNGTIIVEFNNTLILDTLIDKKDIFLLKGSKEEKEEKVKNIKISVIRIDEFKDKSGRLLLSAKMEKPNKNKNKQNMNKVNNNQPREKKENKQPQRPLTDLERLSRFI